MQIGIFETSEEASAAAACGVIDLLARKLNVTFGVTVGLAPEGLYSELRKAHAVGCFTLKSSATFALDEYVGIADGHPEECRNVLRRELMESGKTRLIETGPRTPVNSDAGPYLAAGQYEVSITAAGGVDLQILGIGANRHIGFNEPGGSLVSRARAEVFSRRTRTDNAHFFDGDANKVPSHCTMRGLGTIMETRSLLLFVFGAQKAEAVRQLIEGAISAKWPVAVAQIHPDLTVFVDVEAAELLKYADLYHERWSLV